MPVAYANVNSYHRQLTDEEIAKGRHRDFVGGDWEQNGRWQFDLLHARGLAPQSRLLDVGCGALRGGVHFIRYLDPGNYYGVDVNASLIKAGIEVELPAAGLVERAPHLLVSDRFAFGEFQTTFHFALAQSLFTHLPINLIDRCLVQVSEVLEPGGRLYATWLESPTMHHLDDLRHPRGIVSHSDADPYHYHFSIFRFLVEGLPLRVKHLGDLDHPRSVSTMEFTRL
jgi:SAM-dependent methyltransferase